MAECGTADSMEGITRSPDGLVCLSPHRIDRLKNELAEHGVAVVPGILTESQCDDYITEVHQWLARFGQNSFPDNVGSIIHKYNIAHLTPAWHARLHAVPVFEALWGTEKLVSSIDGMAIGQPPELGAEHFDSGKDLNLNLHLDQGPKKIGLHAYQGAVYLEEALEDDWCFVVMDKSHVYHPDYFAQRGPKPPRSEFLKLTQKEIDWYIQQGCPVRRIAVPKGGMVLWDSRTVHSGARPKLNRENAGRWRYVAFVCMAPAIWASIEEMAIKRDGYHQLGCSRHWPALGFSLFRERNTPGYLKAVHELPAIALTEKARLLAGDLEYEIDGKPKGPAKPKILT